MNLQRTVLAPALLPAELRSEQGLELPGNGEAVLGAAVLVASAFRLRDESGLVVTLRLLTNAVAAWEAAQEREEQS